MNRYSYMDELARKLGENESKIQVFVRQGARTNLCNDKSYIKLMKDEFDKRG